MPRRLRWIPALLLIALFANASAASATRYELDSSHASVVFRVNHLGLSGVFGQFRELAGSGEFDAANPSAGKLEFTIETASIDTNQERRDKHLRSPDFFNAAEFPEITFTSTKFDIGDDDKGTLTGDLTMLGVTKPVTFDVTFNHVGPHPDPRRGGKPTVGLSAKGAVTRSDFGMKAFLPGIGDDIEIWIEVEAIEP